MKGGSTCTDAELNIVSIVFKRETGRTYRRVVVNAVQAGVVVNSTGLFVVSVRGHARNIHHFELLRRH